MQRCAIGQAATSSKTPTSRSESSKSDSSEKWGVTRAWSRSSDRARAFPGAHRRLVACLAAWRRWCAMPIFAAEARAMASRRTNGRKSDGRRSNGRKIGYAVVGLGHIAQTAVLPAFANAKNSRLVALVSDDEEKREKLSRKYGCEAFSYEQYEEC